LVQNVVVHCSNVSITLNFYIKYTQTCVVFSITEL